MSGRLCFIMVAPAALANVTGNDGITGCRFGYVRESDGRVVQHAPYFMYREFEDFIGANYPEQLPWWHDVPYYCDFGDPGFQAHARINWPGLVQYMVPGWYGVVVPPWTAPKTGTTLTVEGAFITSTSSEVSWDEETLDVEQPYPVFIIRA
jgi:hypothetical protein